MHEYIGNLHIHTRYSDGEKWHKELAHDAARAGLDFIVVTDHNVWVQGVEGYYDFPEGRVLLLTGEEVHDPRRRPQANHFLVYGTEQEMSPYARDPQKLIDATNAAGGCGFLAHPYEENLPLFTEGGDLGWKNWEVDGYTGLEIWNYMSSFKNEVSRYLSRLSRQRGLYARVRILPLALHPERYIVGPEPQVLTRWDELLAAGKHIAAIGNSDAHGTPMHLGPITREIFPYEFLFRAVNTHVLLRRPSASRTGMSPSRRPSRLWPPSPIISPGIASGRTRTRARARFGGRWPSSRSSASSAGLGARSGSPPPTSRWARR